MEYLEDSEVDFSSDDDDDEDDMEDFVGPDDSRRGAGHLGKRPSGKLSLLQLPLVVLAVLVALLRLLLMSLHMAASAYKAEVVQPVDQYILHEP